MKKFVCLLMVAMMALSLSLAVFAANGTVQPMIDCDHQYGTHDVLYQSGIRTGTCRYKDVYRVYCNECGRVVDSYNDFYTSHDGPIREVNGVDICQSCGKRA